MKLNHGLQLTYCTNIHRGETWTDIFRTLQTSTLAVRERVHPGQPFGIGLRLSHQAAQELSDPSVLQAFRRWLDQQHCYVFTLNGAPFGRFHGTRVKEQAYMPDWTSPERLEYTKLLFDVLARLLPRGVEGSVSTLPGGLKSFVTTPEEWQMIRNHLWRCVEHVARVSEQTDHQLSLALEPEPLCVLENSRETILFFDRLRIEHHNDPRLAAHLGVCYDTSHFAVAFEEPQTALSALCQHGIKISKIQLNNALKAHPTPDALAALMPFAEDVYLHQVVIRTPAAKLKFHMDLPHALAHESAVPELYAEGAPPGETVPPSAFPVRASVEWRIHYRVPLHTPSSEWLETTADHILGTLDWLQANPTACPHLELETYTWEVLPPELKHPDAVDQIVAEYEWILTHLAERGLVDIG